MPAAGAPPRSSSICPSRRTSRTAFFDEPPDADDPLPGFAPYLHTAPRRNSITPERQRAFIVPLAATEIVTQRPRTKTIEAPPPAASRSAFAMREMVQCNHPEHRR
ncbi:hypothetical protein [Novosphingobium naphthalenivorans]|uniref:hypothetical protein n=1 Tax=Novosphingobium naphthalenivorans TaxID=273168 RepID=UPI000836206B|nr:hypothetical protein [Novosphingobium naphthalenivorans]